MRPNHGLPASLPEVRLHGQASLGLAHRVLLWGILDVIALRAIMIGLGATLVSQFSWVLYVFGAFLIFTGIKMWIIADHMPDIANT